MYAEASTVRSPPTKISDMEACNKYHTDVLCGVIYMYLFISSCLL